MQNNESENQQDQKVELANPDNVLRNLLAMPPQPKKPKAGKEKTAGK